MIFIVLILFSKPRSRCKTNPKMQKEYFHNISKMPEFYLTGLSSSIKYPNGLYIGKYPYYYFMFNT